MMTKGTLAEKEPHPSAIDAMAWIKRLSASDLALWQEAFASTSLSGNRLAEVCSETIDRLMRGDMVSDRYLLGLVWAMRYEDLPSVEDEPQDADTAL